MIKGSKRTKAAKRKHSLTTKGRPRPGNPLNWKHSEKTKQKIKLWLRDNREKRINENSHNWKGGIGGYIKQKAKERDLFTCRICGLKDKEIIVADHIKPKSIYPELKNDINNMQALCPNCHARKSNREKIDIIRIKRARIAC